MSNARRRVGVVPSEELTGSGTFRSQRRNFDSPIDAQLRLIDSGKALERARGIQLLADLLDEDWRAKGSAMASTLAQSTWEQVITCTAGILIKEAQVFINRHAEEWPSQMSAAGDRLSSRIQTQYSVHVRHIWVAAMPFLSVKLARSLTKHITESLLADPCLAHVVGLDYAKVLRAWAAHDHHVLACKGARAEAVVSLCIRSLSRFGNGAMADTQASTESAVAAQGVMPGDAEYAAVMLAVVAAATPARMEKLADSVLGFCAEYCRHHTRENPCFAAIIDSAISVVLATVDALASDDASSNGGERICAILACCLQLWTTRSAHLKRSLLQAIRILTRIMATADEGRSGESEARPVLELALKQLTTGAWDKAGFMRLPRSLLGIWPMVHSGPEGAASCDLRQPLQKFGAVLSIVDPLQLAYFDAVGFLVAHLAATHPRPSGDAATATATAHHRKKRTRTAPTALARMLAAMCSEDSPASSRGAAQLVWYVFAVYADKLGPLRCSEALQDISQLVQDNDLSQRADLAEWALGTIRLLQRRGTADTMPSEGGAVPCDPLWQHAIAGVESALAGAAGLVFDMLHRCQASAPKVHQLCRQAAAALEAGPPSAYDSPDALQLALLLAQYMRSDESRSPDDCMAGACFRAAAQLCQNAAKQRWPHHLFAAVLSRALGLSQLPGPAHMRACVPAASWISELRVSGALQTLDAYIDDTRVCQHILRSHCSASRPPSEPPSEPRAPELSALSPTQWYLVGQSLLKCIEQCTENEYAPVSRSAVPYIAHTLWQISMHVETAQQSLLRVGGANGASLAVQIADGFCERLVAFATDAKQPELLWQTLTFISPWSRGYSRLAGLDSLVAGLLAAVFAPATPDLLCGLALGNPAHRLAGSSALAENLDALESQVSSATEANQRMQQMQLDHREKKDYATALETYMLAVASGHLQDPWTQAVRVLRALASHRDTLAAEIASVLPRLIDTLEGAPLLVASGFVAECIMLGTPSSRPALLARLKARMLAFLESPSHTGHMPTLFSVLQTVCLLIRVSEHDDGGEVDEDLPRFVAWIMEDARNGLVDAAVEMHLMRAVVGPWGRRESQAMCRALSIIEAQPTDFLVYRTQTATTFTVRMVAEEQLAEYGLALPHLLADGSIEYPEAPVAGADNALTLMTRDIGLAMLVYSSQTVAPGALRILIMQICRQGVCSPQIVSLCRRLLRSIAALMGFGTLERMVGECGADILSIDPEILDSLSALAPSAVPWLVTDAALEHTLQGNFAQASAVLSKLPAVTAGSASRMYAHAMVLSASDARLFATAYAQILVPCFSEARLADMLENSPEMLVLELLALYLPQSNTADSTRQLLASMPLQKGETPTISRAYERHCLDTLQPTLTSSRVPQWGRRYGLDAVTRAINKVAQDSAQTSTGNFLTSPRIAWIAIHLQARIQSACFDDERQRLMHSLCLLLSISVPASLDSPLVQPIIFRILTDNWLCAGERTSLQACLAFSLLLDSSKSVLPQALVFDHGAGLLSTLTQDISKMQPQDARRCALAVACLLKAVDEVRASSTLSYATAPELLIGSTLESVYDWAQLSPTMVITGSAIRRADDRVSLARIADRAASLLLLLTLDSTSLYSVSCAEFVVASTERLLQLALPIIPTSNGVLTQALGVALEGPTQIDLASEVIKVLTGAGRKVFEYLRKFSGTSSGSAYQRAITMLLRTMSLMQMLDQSPADVTAPLSSAARDRLLREGDLLWLVCDIVTRSHSQSAIAAAIGVVAELNSSRRLVESAVRHLDGRQRQVLRDVSLMPAVASLDSRQYPIWIQQHQQQRLDSAFLEAICSTTQTPSGALSELVCALASYAECKLLKLAIPLMFADSHSASCLLPHVMFEILPGASTETREEIAAFLLDFVHNWRERAPAMARIVIDGTLQMRQLDHQRYSDIREFFGHLPIALFEMADLAAKLNMPETATFLLECDLTCTGAERLTGIDSITGDARELLRSVYQSLGNQPAAQLLSSVQSVNDVMRRCQDTSDWRTLLLYQEAAPGNFGMVDGHAGAGDDGEFEIGDTLVNLGLLNSIRPGTSSWDVKPLAGVAGHGARALNGGLQATFAASWRLAKWDVPAIPLLQHQKQQEPSTDTAALLVQIAKRPEESLYSMFKMRSFGQLAEASLAVQEYMSDPSAITALTSISSGGMRNSWTYHAVSALLPLISGSATNDGNDEDIDDDSDCDGVAVATESGGFVHVSQITSFLLSRCCGGMQASSMEPVYLANLTLHEIAVREIMAARPNSRALAPVFGRYREAVRFACMASRQAQSWQNSMNHIFRLRAMSRAAGIQDRTLEPELKLWEAETLWDAGSRNLAIEILQSHKCQIERTLQQAKAASMQAINDIGIGNSNTNGSRRLETTLPLLLGSAAAAAPWQRNEIEATTILLSRIILTVGEWSDKQRRERPKVLWDEYFNKSAQLLQEINSPTVWTGRALHALAEFAARQCEELTETRDDEAASAVRKQKSRELAACRQEVARTSNATEATRLKAIQRRLEIQEANDQNELAELRSSIGGFLHLAIWSFVKCLECTDAFDSSVFSLVSLVVTNARSTELQKVLSPGLMDSVPSHKFLPLVHQLCARLSTEEDVFHKTISQLVLRMTVEYPYHTMYHLFALRNANRTSSTQDASRTAPPSSASVRSGRKSAGSTILDSLQVPESEKMEQRRSEAATQILLGVTSNNADLKSIVQAIDELCSVYIELAVSPVPEKFKNSKLDGKLIAFGSRLRITRLIKNLPPNIPVLTAIPHTDAPRDYMCVPFISTISEGYSLAGGINLPKITRIIGTDGRRYKQLVKGKDDMRQDAVIQQLFHVINRFMRTSGGKVSGQALPFASGMHIRTYQVVPLTKRCGVLQWVDNTTPFGNWFRENEPKYRPGAPGFSQLRNTVHTVHKEKEVTVQEKLEVFERVCAQAPPIFRFFFYEHFYHAQSWFEHRETYIRSAAASSIAGWVLGIGDRHLQNILIDQTTAELVHIDLGIAFDLGKLLPIPELVPFRLTREMVDGMGMLGLNGTFRHFCQAALEAMRENARVVITILNVLKVDPLYMWSLIPLRLDKINRNVSMYVGDLRGEGVGSDDGDFAALYGEDNNAAAAALEENKEAGRSILHVGQRLGAGISAEGQVSELIQQATDPRLLSRMFEGWSAWY
ncbi:hypothetical protein LPJ66_000051 [Kickxella alabastrina]|uniref:Uncharacterized protein n=1 Tax=Kickxella alabastrina TaxID=61397 RepID=A0ACC1IX51_9FUNG|nr:hypothetical protein LPJ66_000051 [Kickxella alabastrina]